MFDCTGSRDSQLEFSSLPQFSESGLLQLDFYVNNNIEIFIQYITTFIITICKIVALEICIPINNDMNKPLSVYQLKY